MEGIFKKSSILLVGTFLGMFFLLITNKILTSVMNTSEFGELSYVFNFFTFIQTICGLGVFYAIGNKIARCTEEVEVKKLTGLSFYLVLLNYLIIAIVYVLVFVFYLKDEKSFFSEFFIYSIPLVIVYCFNSFSESVFHCFKNNKYLVIYRILPRLLFLLAVIFMYYWKMDFYLKYVFIVFLLSSLIVHILILLDLKPNFHFVYKDLVGFFTTDFKFGFNVYLGSIISLGAVSFTGILIGFFSSTNQSEIGFYNLAIQLSAPLTLLPNVIVTSSYSSFVSLNRLGSKYLMIVFIICLLTVFSLFLMSNYVVSFIYGEKYMYVSHLNKILLVGYFFYGLAESFNKFILAKGYGSMIRNMSVIVGLVLLSSNMILIPYYGAEGAAISIIISGISFLIVAFYNYYKIVK